MALALRMRDCVRDPDGSGVLSEWRNNALTAAGQASMLNAYFRGIPPPMLYLALLDMPDYPPTRTQRMADDNWRESEESSVNGYHRVPLMQGDWLEPSFAGSTTVIDAVQKEFGPMMGRNHHISHVAVVTTPEGDGDVILYVPGSQYAKAGVAQVVAPGQSYLVQLQDQQT